MQDLINLAILIAISVPTVIVVGFIILFAHVRSLKERVQSLEFELAKLRPRAIGSAEEKAAEESTEASVQKRPDYAASENLPSMPAETMAQAHEKPPTPADIFAEKESDLLRVSSPAPAHVVPLVASEISEESEINNDAPAVKSESNIAARVFIWLGGIALTFAGFFFIKYAFEQGLLSPELRVIAGFAFACVLWIGALFFQRREGGKIICAVLAGAASAVIYGDIYVAQALYGMISPAVAFVLAIACTVFTLYASSRFGHALAIMAMFGGFLTPFVLDSNEANTYLLFSYFAVLTLGFLRVFSIRKQWVPALLMLVFDAFWAFYWGSSHTGNVDLGLSQEGNIAGVIVPFLFLGLLWACYLLFAYRQRTAFMEMQKGLFFPFFAFVPGFMGIVYSVTIGSFNKNIVTITGGTLSFFVGMFLLGLWEHRFARYVFWGIYTILLCFFLHENWGSSYTAIFCVLGIPALLLLAAIMIKPVRTIYMFAWECLCAAIFIYVYFASEYFTQLSYWNFPALFLACLGAAHWLIALRSARIDNADNPLPAIIVPLGGLFFLLHYAFALLPTLLTTPTLALLALAAFLINRFRKDDTFVAMGGIAAIGIFFTLGKLGGALAEVFMPRMTYVASDLPVAATFFSWASATILLILAYRCLRIKEERFTQWRPVFAAIPSISFLLTFAIASLAFMPATRTSQSLYFFLSLMPLGVLAGALVLIRIGERRTIKGAFYTGCVGLALVCVRYFIAEWSVSPVDAYLFVGGVLLFNSFLFSFFIPGIAYLYVARKTKVLVLKHIASIACVLSLFIYGVLQVRFAFQGNLMSEAASMSEFYCYSMYTLLFGGALLGLGYWFSSKVLNAMSMVFVLLAVAKVFIFDAAALEGLLRVFSFTLLGASLIGIGYFYARVVFKKETSEK